MVVEVSSGFILSLDDNKINSGVPATFLNSSTDTQEPLSLFVCLSNLLSYNTGRKKRAINMLLVTVRP